MFVTNKNLGKLVENYNLKRIFNTQLYDWLVVTGSYMEYNIQIGIVVLQHKSVKIPKEGLKKDDNYPLNYFRFDSQYIDDLTCFLENKIKYIN